MDLPGKGDVVKVTINKEEPYGYFVNLTDYNTEGFVLKLGGRQGRVEKSVVGKQEELTAEVLRVDKKKRYIDLQFILN